ncbi:MAG TPA: LCP family protein, partial [Candidatus Limnocylindrales bacterium]|nr:LCP family protein [Candidatus Limnocylindrales bacterium]
MHAEPAGLPRARSPFAAAFLSLIFPGLGHAYAGATQRALAFGAAPVLILALVAGIFLRVDRAELVGYLLVPWVLPGVFVINLVVLVYRLIAIVDAYRVTAYLNAFAASGGGRLGRPRVPVNAVSVAGLAAVILVMAGGHVALARYDSIAMQTANCIFDPDSECGGSPGPSDSGDPGDSGDAATPDASVSLPPEGSALPNATVPPWNGKERLNILLIGADEQANAHNTDTLIVVSIDPVSHQVAMFSLPRDTVDIPLPSGPLRAAIGPVYPSKINSLFLRVRGRADLFPGTSRTRPYNALKAVLGQLYGLDVKYYVEVNFDGFTKVVDALGGVNVNVQVPVIDNGFPLPGSKGALHRIYIPSGVQHMTGSQALVYARARHLSNDYQRGQRQQRVLLSLREQMDFSVVLPHINDLAKALSQAVRTDVPRDLLPQLLRLAESIDAKTMRSYVFAPNRFGFEGSQQGLGFVIHPYVDRIRAAVRDAFAVDPALEARRQKLTEEGARVWVLNASGQSGEASDIAAYLEYRGLTASAPTQRPPGGNRSATRIVVYNGAEGRMPDTVKLLQDLFEVTIE